MRTDIHFVFHDNKTGGKLAAFSAMQLAQHLHGIASFHELMKHWPIERAILVTLAKYPPQANCPFLPIMEELHWEALRQAVKRTSVQTINHQSLTS